MTVAKIFIYKFNIIDQFMLRTAHEEQKGTHQEETGKKCSYAEFHRIPLPNYL